MYIFRTCPREPQQHCPETTLLWVWNYYFALSVVDTHWQRSFSLILRIDNSCHSTLINRIFTLKKREKLSVTLLKSCNIIYKTILKVKIVFVSHFHFTCPGITLNFLKGIKKFTQNLKMKALPYKPKGTPVIWHYFLSDPFLHWRACC